MDISHLSPSGLRLLHMCGEAFRRKYVEKQPMTSGLAAAVGTAVHKSAERDLTAKRDEGELQAEEVIVDTAADAFEIAIGDSRTTLTKEERQDKAKVLGKAKDQAIGLARVHHHELAPMVAPKLIEHRFDIEFDGFPLTLVGYVDLVEDDNTIRDLKTRGKKPRPDDATDDIGLAWYAMSLDVSDLGSAPALALDVLVKTKTPKLETVWATSPMDHGPLLARIERAALVIEAGAYLPAPPDHWKCSEKFCDFYNDCPFGRARRIQI